MKTQSLFKPLLAVMVICCAGMFHQAEGQVASRTTCTACKEIAIKDTLKLPEPRIKLNEGFIKDGQQGRKQEIYFAYLFRYKMENHDDGDNADEILIRESIDSICMSVLINDMYSKAAAAMQSDKRCKGDSCISGMKIRYGLVREDAGGLDTSTIVYYYKPVYLFPEMKKSKQVCETDSDGERTCSFSLQNVGSKFYRYDSCKQVFFEVDEAKIKRDTLNYDNLVKVKRHRGNINFKDRDIREKWLGDSESIIFSFQELLAVYHANYKEVEYHRYKQKIHVRNGAAFYVKGTWTSDFLRRSRAKHTTLITSADWDDDGKKGKVLLNQTDVKPGHANKTTGGNVGNLAHLCPPSCNNLSYPMN